VKKILLGIGLLFGWGLSTQSQELVNFYSGDSLLIAADYYASDPQAPYVLFFHQARSSRGEYRSIAPRFVKMGFNGLAVDLRSGNEMNYITNETAVLAKNEKLNHTMTDAISDIRAAIHFAFEKSGKPVVLFGSSYSASLVLEEAKSNPHVSAVIAFSPGEYFRRTSVKDSLSGLDKSFFVTGTKSEEKYIRELMSTTHENKGSLFFPEKGNGVHGARALWNDNPNASEYWFSLVLFVRSLHLVNE